MVHIIVLNENHLDQMGIYRIWFGHKYYIGSTINTTKRSFEHECSINERFLYENRGKCSRAKITSHIDEHSYINFGFFEMLRLCDDERSLVYWEQKYLNGCRQDPNCLNVAFSVHRKINGEMIYGRDEISDIIKCAKFYVEWCNNNNPTPSQIEALSQAQETANCEWIDHKVTVFQALE